MYWGQTYHLKHMTRNPPYLSMSLSMLLKSRPQNLTGKSHPSRGDISVSPVSQAMPWNIPQNSFFLTNQFKCYVTNENQHLWDLEEV